MKMVWKWNKKTVQFWFRYLMNKKGIRCTWSTVGVRSLRSVLFNIVTSVLVPKHSELSYVDNVMVQPLFTSSSQYDCVPVTEISAVNLSQ